MNDSRTLSGPDGQSSSCSWLSAGERLARELRLTPASFAARVAFIGLGRDDIADLVAIHHALRDRRPAMIEAFYDHLLAQPTMRAFLDDATLLARLKVTQSEYFDRLTAGCYDFAYAVDRLRVGSMHQLVGLQPAWYLGAYGQYLALISAAVSDIHRDAPARIGPTLAALNKVALLDITLAMDAYLHASQREVEAARQEAERQFRNQTRNLRIIERLQRAFISDAGTRPAVEILLEELMRLTGSRLGLVGHRVAARHGARLSVEACRDAETPLAMGRPSAAQFEQLLGLSRETTEVLIRNELAAGQAQAELDNFLGLPILHGEGEQLGLVGLANRPGGYDEALVQSLQPLLNTLGELLMAGRTRVALRDSQRQLSRFKHTLDQTLDAVFIFDLRGATFTYVNRGAEELFGYSCEQLLTMRLFDLDPACDAARLDALLMPLLSGDRASLTYEALFRKQDGSLFPAEAFLQYVAAQGDGEFICILRDISERKQHEETLAQLAFYDALTGLPNRNRLAARLDDLMPRAQRSGQPLAMFYLDLRNLHEINDTLGLETGDRIIRLAGERICATLASIVTHGDGAVAEGDGHVVARITSDEFAVLAMLGSEEGATVLVEYLLAQFRRPFVLAREEVQVGARAGVALALPGEDAASLMSNADMALQQAKRRGEPYLFYDRSLGQRGHQRIRMARRLSLALQDERGFSLHYQPQVDLATGKLCGMEALLRWEDAELGRVSPGEFIPLAEERGLIVRLTRIVLKRALQQYRQWRDAGAFGDARPPLAVNVSVRDLASPDFVGMLRRLTAEAGLEPGCLEIEITETDVMSDIELVMDVLQRLREAGFRLAIDDFGTGQSALAYLKRIPADVLKIDMSFVRNMGHDRADHAIVETIIAMARIFGMRTLAEGVEEEGIARALRVLGCDQAQGYLFAAPMPAEAFAQRWLQSAGD